MSTDASDLTDLPGPHPSPLIYVRYRDKGKWQEEPMKSAHEAVERARTLSKDGGKVYVMRAVWAVLARMEKGEQTLSRTMTLYTGEEP